MARLCPMIFVVVVIACGSVWFVVRLHLVPGIGVRAGGSLRQSESSLLDVS
ncbi:hypothetical protein SISNIDRAFT_447585 [Sistotremastrum niveocremeum HHB9708]|uniref:Uncharacterized protein n=1 Tax=Sistotremastrum niveocremeum HHB9708 TaxID=1314777 RepID=A0A165ACA3_9AGAM|nr:hypothetical protein SISNIDRAFT_447585 [Sistotremastrum niveocremeum HHB9708]